MVFAMDGWYTYTIIIGARNQHTASGAYEFHIHRAYIIYGITNKRNSVLHALLTRNVEKKEIQQQLVPSKYSSLPSNI